MDCSRGFTRIFILHDNIETMHVVTVSVGNLDTIAKNYLRRVSLRLTDEGLISVTFHFLSFRRISSSIQENMFGRNVTNDYEVGGETSSSGFY